MGKAVRLFNGNAEQTLCSRLTPSPEQREFLQQQWNALADHLKAELPAKHGYSISTWLQGSYKYGTLIKPVHRGEQYDVDMGVYFEWTDEEEAEPTAAQLRDWVQRELLNFEKITTDVTMVQHPPLERCSRVVYEKQFHIDTPVYHLKPEEDERRLACLSDRWEDSDPKAFYKWFRNAVEEDSREQLRRLIRYLKGWAAVAFNDAPAARPSSTLLTVLATDAFNTEWLGLFAKDDEDALTAIVKSVRDRLNDSREVPNPVDSGEDLNRIASEAWDDSLRRIEVLREAAQEAAGASDEPSAALAWAKAFSFLMPLPEAESVEVVEELTGTALMQLPEIRIDVYKRNPKQLTNTYTNEVPGVPKDCDLVFTITNPHVVPQYATVEWTVRNDGAEAESIGDLGHRNGGIRMLSAEEHTAYDGKHSMDCVIRQNGQVYALRRVPVMIRDIRYPPRNPRRPAYTKLRTFLRFR